MMVAHPPQQYVGRSEDPYKSIKNQHTNTPL